MEFNIVSADGVPGSCECSGDVAAMISFLFSL